MGEGSNFVVVFKTWLAVNEFFEAVFDPVLSKFCKIKIGLSVETGFLSVDFGISEIFSIEFRTF